MQSILCIPGNWRDNNELVLSIVNATAGEYIYAGMVLMAVKGQQAFTLEVQERDERLYDAFTWAGKLTGISEETLQEIQQHQHVVYLIAETGSYESAEAIARAAGALLKAGGLAVKIETAGKAFDKETWLAYLNDFETSHLFEMFVVDSLSQHKGEFFSCGMHNLGLKDTIVNVKDPREAIHLIRVFGYYQIVDNPTIIAKQTFTPTLESPKYVITEEVNQPYKGNEVFENPFGMWRLKKKSLLQF